MGLAAALGYQFLIYVLAREGAIFFRGDTVETTLRSFENFQIRSLLATPFTLANFVANCDRHPSIDVHLDTIISGGSMLPRSLAERVRPRLCAHLVTGYGSTETAISATARAHQIAHIDGAVGYITPGVRIEIVDEADRQLPCGTEGVVRISGEYSVDRYVEDAAESARFFRNGWFYPGDIGSITPENLLIIAGRRDNLINVGGDKLTAERIEAALDSFEGVNQAAVFAAPGKLGVEEVWAAVVCPGKIDLEHLKAYCRLRMPQPFVPAHVVVLDALPINAAGKVDRLRLKEMLIESARF